jgi:cytochrome c-type biogenesis protein CcmH/NrfG
MRLAAVGVVAVLLSACTTGIYQQPGQPPSTTAGPQPAAGESPAPVDPNAAPPGPVLRPGPIPRTGPSAPQGGAIGRLPDAPEPSRAAGATAALLEQSRSERGAGELDRAAATLERGLSLSPDDPALWVELAEIRLAQGNAALAQETARKALTLTGNDYALEARARRLIGR